MRVWWGKTVWKIYKHKFVFRFRHSLTTHLSLLPVWPIAFVCRRRGAGLWSWWADSHPTCPRSSSILGSHSCHGAAAHSGGGGLSTVSHLPVHKTPRNTWDFNPSKFYNSTTLFKGRQLKKNQSGTGQGPDESPLLNSLFKTGLLPSPFCTKAGTAEQGCIVFPPLNLWQQKCTNSEESLSVKQEGVH